VLAIGLAGLLHSWVAWVALLMGIVSSVVRWRLVGGPGHCVGRSWASGRLGSWSWSWRRAWGLSACWKRWPPLKWDSLVYHLELPRQYIRLGRIGFVEGNLFVGFPQIGEMNFTWAMALRGGAAAATLGWVTGVIALLGVAGFARRLIGGRGGLMAWRPAAGASLGRD
jgi:hypothetical protein